MRIRIKVKPKSAKDTSECCRNVGSAKVLSGRIFVLCVFVAPYNDPWKPADIERQKENVYEAEQWMKMQALRYGKHVEFVNSAFGADGTFLDNDIPKSSHSDNAYDYPSNLLLKVGFRSKKAFVEWARAHEGCPQCLAIIFSNTCGRSFACPVSKELHAYCPDEYNLEACLLYRKFNEEYQNETGSAAIAHEVLHLFGAWDLYEIDDNDHNRAVKTSQMFPNSIMLCNSHDIWETKIDEINAWLVGLRNEGKDWYRWFEPHQDSYECE